MQQIRYGVLGAGRQGTAAAYDMALRGGAESVVVADADMAIALQAAQRVNDLVGRPVATAAEVDAEDHPALVATLEPLDVYLCAVPFLLIPACTRAAIEARTGMVDLGGHTETVLGQLALDEEAKAAGISIVPDCGMGPGMNNTLGMYLVEQLEAAGATPRAVRLYDGGLPQDRPQPWGYRAAFDIDGLTNEYDGHAVFLRNGRVTMVEALTEPETQEFAELGTLEAFVTSGGTSTVPYTMEGKLETYENKTLRYPGHLAAFKAFKDLGLFRREPIRVDGAMVSPRRFYHALLEPQIATDDLRDVCILRACGQGRLEGREVELIVELIDRFDDTTGFSAMERITGWHAAAMTELIGRGAVAPGVHRMEQAVPALTFMEEIRGRQFEIEERWS